MTAFTERRKTPRAEQPGWVQDMEEALDTYYGEPVAPVTRYCDAFREWAQALRENYPLDTDQPEQREHRLQEIVRALPAFELAISKSSLLARMIYAGEPRRSRKCPVHKGRWSGLAFEETPCGCDLTGWLRENEKEEA